MTPACRSLAATACAFWVSAVAFGQPPVTVDGPFRNPYGRSLEWLANPQVQEELNLTAKKRDQVEQARLEMRRKVRDLYRSKELNERDPRKRAQAYRERIQALSDEAEDKARAILSREQADRLHGSATDHDARRPIAELDHAPVGGDEVEQQFAQ